MADSISIMPMGSSHAETAAGLFVSQLVRQRQITPSLPAVFEDLSLVTDKLRWLISTGNVLAALRGERLVGYLGWFIVPGFRGTSQKGAYCCEWGHATVEHDRINIYRQLYAHAAVRWQNEGCGTHALTTLAQDTTLHQFLFWNGFGLAVVEGMKFLADTRPSSQRVFTLRQATLDDMGSLCSLDELLAGHLRAPSVCMRRKPWGETKFREFLCQESNTVWLAEEGKQVVGFLRLQIKGQGATDIVGSPDAVGIAGAYVLESHRRQGIAALLLEEASHWYRAKGCARCSVDWESLNPQANGFWLKRFAPVCYSLIRHVESAL
jgi:GNAT superfamily N-acetyltransferase